MTIPGARLALYFPWWLPVILSLPARGASAPRETNVLASAACSDSNGKPFALRMTEYRYYPQNEQARSIALVFAVEAGEPIGCPIRRIWQDAEIYSGSVVRFWSGAVFCQKGEKSPYVILANASRDFQVNFKVYSFDLLASVRSWLPLAEPEKAREESLRPQAIGEITLETAPSYCAERWVLTAVQSEAGLRLSLGLPSEEPDCPPAAVDFDPKARKFTVLSGSFKPVLKELPGSELVKAPAPK